MDRRTFTTTLATVGSVVLVQTLLRKRLLAESARLTTTAWLREVDTICRDVRSNALDLKQWQTAIADLHDRLAIADLVELVDLDALDRHFVYPKRGVVTKDLALPKIRGVSERYTFIARVFGMTKGRAIIPHGHRNMVSCHRVIGGTFRLRQYDRLADDGEHVVLRQTRDETAVLGSASSISDARENVHWLVATSSRAFTFDVIVADLGGKPTEIDNLDLDAATKLDGDTLRARKLDVNAALAKYG